MAISQPFTMQPNNSPVFPHFTNIYDIQHILINQYIVSIHSTEFHKQFLLNELYGLTSFISIFSPSSFILSSSPSFYQSPFCLHVMDVCSHPNICYIYSSAEWVEIGRMGFGGKITTKFIGDHTDTKDIKHSRNLLQFYNQKNGY